MKLFTALLLVLVLSVAGLAYATAPVACPNAENCPNAETCEGVCEGVCDPTTCANADECPNQGACEGKADCGNQGACGMQTTAGCGQQAAGCGGQMSRTPAGCKLMAGMPLSNMMCQMVGRR